jgi:hypothetical protein
MLWSGGQPVSAEALEPPAPEPPAEPPAEVPLPRMMP